MDLKRESDIEQLRRIAVAQQTQIEQLLRLLASQAAELGALKGNEAELQQKLALIEELTRQSVDLARETQDAPGATSPSEPKARKPRTAFGNTAQPSLPVVEQTFEIDAADMTCPSCGGVLAPMKGQFETSEMIDLVDVSYRVVKVQQQKYVCKCGGCVETAPGPERAMPGGRYSLDFAIKSPSTSTSITSHSLARSASCGATASSSRRKRSGTSSRRSEDAWSPPRVRSWPGCSRSPSSASTRPAGHGSMARATSPGRCGA